jgi:hypothetical protein
VWADNDEVNARIGNDDEPVDLAEEGWRVAKSSLKHATDPGESSARGRISSSFRTVVPASKCPFSRKKNVMSPTEKLIQIHRLAEDAIYKPEPGKTLASIAGIGLTPAGAAIDTPISWCRASFLPLLRWKLWRNLMAEPPERVGSRSVLGCVGASGLWDWKSRGITAQSRAGQDNSAGSCSDWVWFGRPRHVGSCSPAMASTSRLRRFLVGSRFLAGEGGRGPRMDLARN